MGQASNEGSSNSEEMAVAAAPLAVEPLPISSTPYNDVISAPATEKFQDQAAEGTYSRNDPVRAEGSSKPVEKGVTQPMSTQKDNGGSSPSHDRETSPEVSNSTEKMATTSEIPKEKSGVSVKSVPTTITDKASGGEQSRATPEIDTASSQTAPTILIDSDGGDNSVLDESIVSPHGNDVILERSPGGRYVRFMEKLGSGASKDVYRAYDTQEGIEVAWNVVNLAGVPKNERNRIVNEVRLLERLHHHNIISFHGSWVNRELQQVNFVTEILSSGTLKSFINKVQVIRWKIAKRWAVQILKGLEYLHMQDPPVIHRDLKCENIFINGTSGDLRIGDLGLSTVHRNGKVLSVLGTPEFMAPDMYEENSYDEKVDIYAFGMCLLEIFTKEIPYRECNNPVQIYKKVSRGDPPESLKRLKSRHAREFIELCLGYKDEEGNYIRPSTTELLAHDFLQKRENDDDEVEVDPPMQERVIRENTDSSSPGIRGGSRQSQTESSNQNASPPKAKQQIRSNSLEEIEMDIMEEMPDSEVNIGKVKVLAGRNLELQEDDKPAIKTQTKGLEKEPLQSSSVSSTPTLPSMTAAPISAGNPQAMVSNTNQLHASKLQYLVAAAVIENEQTRPHEDDMLKLVVTLPVEGQTQNVQFDFHLIEDDPVQVAKEMVAELGIPQGAVLEISETVSGLARAARMKQDKYIGRGQRPQGHVRTASQGIVLQQPSIGQMGDFQNQGLVQSSQSLPDFVGNQQIVPPHVHQPGHQQMAVQDPTVQMHAQQMGQQATIPQLQMQPQHIGQQATETDTQPKPPYGQAPLNMNPQLQTQQVGPPSQPDVQIQNPSPHVTHSQHQQPPQSHIQTQVPSLGQAIPLQNSAGLLPTDAKGQHATTHYPHNPAHGQTHALQQPIALSVPQNNNVHQPQHIANQQMMVAQSGQSQIFQQGLAAQQQSMGQQPQVPGHQTQQQMPQLSSVQKQTPLHSLQQQPSEVHQTVGQKQQVPIHLQQQLPNHQQQQPKSHVNGLQQPVPGDAAKSLGLPSKASQNQDSSASLQKIGTEVKLLSVTSKPQQPGPTSGGPMSHSKEKQVNGVLDVPNFNSDADLLDDELLSSELRKLDEDFQKNMMRAKKVFDSRMGNLQRTKHEREAQHQKTLEKHEKERADFEKRMQKEEIEQNRRIEQLQKEWDRRREAVRQKQIADSMATANTGPEASHHQSETQQSGRDGSMSER